MRKIRVLVAEDSLTVRKRMVEVLGADPELEIIAEAENGKRAYELCCQLKPDVITLDVVMPEMTGLEATELIMAYCPTPILIVSASMNRGEAFQTYSALAAGAVDVLDKAPLDSQLKAWETELIDKVKLVSRIKVITHPRARLGLSSFSVPPMPTPRVEQALSDNGSKKPELVAIGASTGGPAAVRAILSAIPRDFPVPILLVIHIGKPFGKMLAEWLDQQSSLRVTTAADREPLFNGVRGRVILAQADRHLTIKDGLIRVVDGPERHSCRPSVDVLFESIAQDPIAAHTVACLLTGMGRDGAEGLLRIRRAGGATLAQDEATSAIFGMPGEAISLGAASRVLPLGDFAPTLIRMFKREGEQV